MEVRVGQLFQDTYNLSTPKHYGATTQSKENLRTIEIVQICANGVRARVVIDTAGQPVIKPRYTTLKFVTLKAGYKLIYDPANT